MSDEQQAGGRRCLRCDDATLVRVDDGAAAGAFFRCPGCGQDYAQFPGRSLTFRWGHPISLALYPVLFEARPADIEPSSIDRQLAAIDTAELRAAVKEIRLELDRPTQAVRDILESRAPEPELRRYLQLYAERAEMALASR